MKYWKRTAAWFMVLCILLVSCLSCLWSVIIQTGNRYKSGSGCGGTFSRNADDRSRGADRSGGRNRDS